MHRHHTERVRALEELALSQGLVIININKFMRARAIRPPAQHSRLPTPRRVPCAHPGDYVSVPRASETSDLGSISDQIVVCFNIGQAVHGHPLTGAGEYLISYDKFNTFTRHLHQRTTTHTHMHARSHQVHTSRHTTRQVCVRIDSPTSHQRRLAP